MFIIQRSNQLSSIFFTKNTCYLETLLRYFENIYEAEKVYTSSDKVISPFAAKDRKIITNH